MPAAPKTHLTKRPKTTKTSTKKAVKPAKKQSRWQRLKTRRSEFLSRRPHRSFRLTRRRDYKRSLKLPGYIAFTRHVGATLRGHMRTFLALIILYATVGLALGSIASQQTMNQLYDSVSQLGTDVFSGNVASIAKAAALSFVVFSGNSQSLTESQQIYVALGFLLVWMTTVWLLREYLAGRAPRLRDGIYSSSSPLVSTLLVALWILVQLLPVGLLALAYTALSGVGILTDGFGAFLFAMLAVIVSAMTLYWVTSTFIALVIVTLPGMYPMRAIKLAGDLVVGRRLRILLRLLWMVLVVFVVWLLIMIPLLLLDGWLRSLANWVQYIPYVPLIAAMLGAASVVWMSSYVYLLYRKVVDDDAAPA